MKLRDETIRTLLENRIDRIDGLSNGYVDWADNYGGREHDSRVTTVLVVDEWRSLQRLGLTARADEFQETYFAQLCQSVGIQWVFQDEYSIEYSVEPLAWRMAGDSYCWNPEAFYDHHGELVTINDDPTVILAAKADEHTTVTLDSGALMFALGDNFDFAIHDGPYKFIRWGTDKHENGWHPGQTDDPTELANEIVKIAPNVQTVVARYEPSQFYVSWIFYVSNEDVR